MKTGESKKFKFTDTRLEKLQAEAKKIDYTDLATKGLMLRVEPTGKKNWKWRGTDSNTGKRVVLAIGSFPALNTFQARAIADGYNAKIETGEKPQTAKQEQAEKVTFGQLFEQWLTTYAKLYKKTWRKEKSAYERHIAPVFANVPADEITTDMIKKFRIKLLNTPKLYKAGNIQPTTVNNMVMTISSVYTQMAKELRNPAAGIKKFPTEKRGVFVKLEDLPRFTKAVDNPETPEWLQDIIWLALLTGARKMNIQAMQWNEISLEAGTWTIPASKFKGKVDHTIHLHPKAVAILRKRSHFTSDYVFPAVGRRESFKGHIWRFGDSWKKVTERAGMPDLHFHDLRRTAGSLMVAAGIPALVTCNTLGHGPEMIPVYQKLQDGATKTAILAAGDKLFESIGNSAQVQKTTQQSDMIAALNKLKETANNENKAILDKIGQLLNTIK